MAFVAVQASPHARRRSRLGRAIGLTLLLAGALAAVSVAAERIGIGAPWIVGTVFAASMTFLAGIGALTGTTRPTVFFLAGRALTASVAGCVGAAACLPPFWLALGERSTDSLAVFAIGATGGLVVSAALVAPFLHRSGAYTPAEFLAARFGRVSRVFTVPASYAVCLFLLAAQLRIAGRLAPSFGVTPADAVWAMLGLVLVCCIAGGARSASAAAAGEVALAVAGILAPLAVLLAARFGTLSPQALADALAAAAADGADRSAGRSSAFAMLGYGLALAPAVAALPGLCNASLFARGSAAARRAPAVALAMLLPALAGVAGWVAVAHLGPAGGVPAAPVPSASTLLDMLAAIPATAQLSATSTALFVAAAAAALLAGSASVLVAAANGVGYDLLNRTLAPKATRSARMAAARLCLLATGVAAAWLALDPRLRDAPFGHVALTLAASVLFPGLVIGIWWKRATRPGALAGMAAGLAATLLLAVPIADLAAAGGLTSGGAESTPAGAFGSIAGLLGALANAAATIAVSLVTAPPPVERQRFADDLRRSVSRPLLHPHEALIQSHAASSHIGG